MTDQDRDELLEAAQREIEALRVTLALERDAREREVREVKVVAQREIQSLTGEILSLQEAQARDAAALVELQAKLAIAVEALSVCSAGGCGSPCSTCDEESECGTGQARKALKKIRGGGA